MARSCTVHMHIWYGVLESSRLTRSNKFTQKRSNYNNKKPYFRLFRRNAFQFTFHERRKIAFSLSCVFSNSKMLQYTKAFSNSTRNPFGKENGSRGESKKLWAEGVFGRTQARTVHSSWNYEMLWKKNEFVLCFFPCICFGNSTKSVKATRTTYRSAEQ